MQQQFHHLEMEIETLGVCKGVLNLLGCFWFFFLVFLFGLSHVTKRGHAQAGEQPAVSHRTSPVALTDIDKKTKASNMNQFGQENMEKNQLQSHALSLCSRTNSSPLQVQC